MRLCIKSYLRGLYGNCVLNATAAVFSPLLLLLCSAESRRVRTASDSQYVPNTSATATTTVSALLLRNKTSKCN